MAGEIGEAYVKIMPTTKGIAGEIGRVLGDEQNSPALKKAGLKTGLTLGKLVATTLKDKVTGTSTWQTAIAEINEDLNTRIGKGLRNTATVAASTFRTIGGFAKVAAVGIGAAAVATGALTKSAIAEGAKLEQSIGGIDTLFGTGGKTLSQYAEAQGKSVAEAADEYWRLERAQTIVLNNADKAFKTAGLSANSYMETATSISGALLKSLGGDTLKGADFVQMAITDMADQANKYGNTVEEVSGTYMSLARGNYQTLDNLFGGMFAGTKAGLNELLEYAEEYRKSQGETVEYSAESYADIVSALHDVSVATGVYGTTAKEAASTISGSAASMKAAWQNVLGKAALGEDVKEPMQELVETARTYLADNLIPAIGNVVRSIPSAFREVGPGIREALPDMAAQGVQVIADFLQGIGDGAPGVGTLISDVMNTAWEKAKEIDWISIGTNLISGIIQGVINSAGRLYMQISQVIGNALVAAEQAGQIHSPSRLFRDRVGEMIPAGVAVGVKNKTSLVQDAVTEMVSQADRSFQLSPRQASGGGVTVNQNIYAKKQSAAELMAESRWQAEKAVLKLV